LAAARVFRRRCVRVELHHVPTGTVAEHEHTNESLQRHLGRAEQTAADAVAAEQAMTAGTDPDEAFPATGGPICAWCDFRRVCPVGSQIPAREPWAALNGVVEAAG
jgi:putative RecB family exonuclease